MKEDGIAPNYVHWNTLMQGYRTGEERNAVLLRMAEAGDGRDLRDVILGEPAIVVDERLRLGYRDGLVTTAGDLENEMQHPPALGGNGGCIGDAWHGGRVAGEATFWARAQNVATG